MPWIATLLPGLSPELQAFVRAAYGLLLFGTLVMALPHGRRFFQSERWGGYGRSEPAVDLVHNPLIRPVLTAAWLCAALLIALGWASPWPALFNLAVCYYFFIFCRWRSLLRGMGAPGFIAFWLGLAVAALELTARHAPALRAPALLTLQIDFALIMLFAGLYKFRAGYRQNHGMQLGMVNPEWGYFWRFYRNVRPSHPLFWTVNQLAWLTEIGAALLMLLPATRPLGAFLIAVSFVFIATQIRLGLLCHMLVAACLLYFPPMSAGDTAVRAVVQVLAIPVGPPTEPLAAASPLAYFVLAHAALLPFVYGGLAYNLYGHRRLPWPLQPAVDRYANLFGIILWRVFSVDVVNFFIEIHRRRKSDGARELVSDWSRSGVGRYNSVAEAIAVTSVFTTLRYYPSDSDLFRERLTRYARTVPCPYEAELVFDYVTIEMRADRFAFESIASFTFDPASGAVVEEEREGASAVRSGHVLSPIHRGSTPGSYAPAPR